MAKEVESIYKEIGSRIQELRNEKMTQRALGQLLNPPATRASIANIENGKQRVLVHTLLQIASIFEKSIDDLLPNIKKKTDSNVTKAVKKELQQKLNVSASQLRNIIRITEDAA